MTKNSTRQATHGTPLSAELLDGVRKAPSAEEAGKRPARVPAEQSGVVPPSCNTGAPNTQRGEEKALKTGRAALLDWFAATFPVPAGPGELLQLLGQLGLDTSDVRHIEVGRFGYTRRLALGSAELLYAGQAQMGVSLQLSGQACREYEARNGEGSLVQLCKLAHERGGSFTRLDVAIDDFTGTIPIEQVREAARARNWRAAWRQGNIVEGIGDAAGSTVNFGSNTGRTKLRVYDKEAQTGEVGPWVRWELQCRDERAADLAKHLMSGLSIGDVAAGHLAACITFVQPSDDTNRARWPVASWWSAFLGDVEKLRWSPVERVLRTARELMDFVERQWAPSLAAIQMALGDGGYSAWGAALLRGGSRRMKEKHVAIVAQARAILAPQPRATWSPA